MIEWLGNLFGIEQLEAVHGWRFSFDAAWAAARPMLVVFAMIIAAAVGIGFYLRTQNVGSTKARAVLAGFRATVLALLILMLAEPVIAFSLSQNPRPLLLVLFDTTDSMNIADKLTVEENRDLAEAVGVAPEKASTELAEATRLDLIRRALLRDDGEVLRALNEKFRLRTYLLDRADQVREIELQTDDAGNIALDSFQQQVEGDASVTAIGEAVQDLRRRHRNHTVAGVVMFSDFDQNTGRPPVPVAEQFAKPFYTVGVGASEIVDIAVEIQSPLVLKQGEKTSATVWLRQSGLSGRTARVELLKRRLGTTGGEDVQQVATPIAPAQSVDLDSPLVTVDMPFTPEAEGRYALIARIDAFEDEVLTENNEAQREVTIRDESLKLLFVEYEPTWEWRFIKEVFHRDPLIGREGFRTFLRSADFKVRRTNDLFLETLVRPRSEFFSYDVIFLSDVTREMLPSHFVDMLDEYVSRFGGGLVVISGPRFGAQALAESKIANMLPVVLDPTAQRVEQDFRLRLTPHARQVDFMNLGETPMENRKAWDNLGRLPWYQPVLKAHPMATVLAEHPNDVGVDSRMPRPIVAMRRYGKGEVIFFAFNETWRLRRMYGEKYYRQLWGQMIYRLGLGRALGDQKRFLVSSDRRIYQAGDKVRISVEAYDEDYEPMSDVDKLDAKLIVGGSDTAPASTRDFTIPLTRDGVVYETTMPVFSTGPHRVLVRDPATYDEVELTFRVAPVSAERRNAVRNLALQRDLALTTGGRSYELTEVAQLAQDIKAPDIETYSEVRKPIWNTWLMLILVVGGLMGEWLLRKMVNLR